MKKYLDKDFENHLKKICKNKVIKNVVTQFYNDIKRIDFPISKNDLESITIIDSNNCNVNYNQDIIEELFFDKDEIMLSEYFVYNFCTLLNHIKLQKPFDKKNERYNIEKKEIVINLKPIDKEMDKVSPEERIKHSLYHELCHVLGVKSFNNNKYFERGLTNCLSIIDKKGYNSTLICDSIADTRKVFYTPLDRTQCQGTILLDEIYNDFIALDIGDFVYVIESSFADETPYLQKYSLGFVYSTKLERYNDYALNYDLLVLLNMAIKNNSIKDSLLKPNTFFAKINQLPFDKDKELDLRNGLKSYFNKSYLMNKTPFELLAINTGLASFESGAVNQSEMLELKTYSQAMLISAIKNQEIAKLTDKKIEKNPEFFQNLNDVLTNIDNVLLYSIENNNNVSELTFINMKKDIINQIEKLPLNERNIAVEKLSYLGINNPKKFSKLKPIAINGNLKIKTLPNEITSLDDLMIANNKTTSALKEFENNKLNEKQIEKQVEKEKNITF